MDENIDPVGACVGLRGARVKNIVRELNNEKVDIIRWSEDLREFTSEALKPAIIKSFEMDEENKVINVTVDEEDLSKAIGRKDESQHEQFEAKLGDAAQHLADSLEIEPKIADALFRAGGVSPEIIISMPVDYLAGSLEVDEAAAQVILDKANALVSGDAPAAKPEATEASAESEETPAAAEEAPKEEAAPEIAEASEKSPAAEE